MKQHITVVGVLHIALGILTLVAGLITAAILLGTGWLIRYEEGGDVALPILVGLGIGLGALLLILALPEIIGGWGVLKYKGWARWLTIIVSAISLVNFPIGTGVGIYSLWVLLQAETEALFSGGGG